MFLYDSNYDSAGSCREMPKTEANGIVPVPECPRPSNNNNNNAGTGSGTGAGSNNNGSSLLVPDMPQKKFPCHLCRRSFMHKQSLDIHMRSHTGKTLNNFFLSKMEKVRRKSSRIFHILYFLCFPI